MEDSKSNFDPKSGIITIKMPPFTKVMKAWSLWWTYLHEIGIEREGCHPSWIGNSQRIIDDIREIKKTMTREEKEEFSKKIHPFIIN